MNIAMDNAASGNRLEDVKTLYNENDLLCEAIALASQNGHMETLEYLLTLNTTKEDRDKGLAEGLFYASQNGYLAVVELLLAEKAPLKRPGHGNTRTALHAAAGGGRNAVVVKLIDAGIKVDVLNEDKCSPLFDAVGSKRVEAVKLLLERGADPDRKGRFGVTPKTLALQTGNEDIIALLNDK